MTTRGNWSFTQRAPLSPAARCYDAMQLAMENMQEKQISLDNNFLSAFIYWNSVNTGFINTNTWIFSH